MRETRAAPTGKAAVFPFSCYNFKCLYVNKTVTIQAYIKHLKDKHSIDVRDNYSVTIRNKYLPMIVPVFSWYVKLTCSTHASCSTKMRYICFVTV